MRMESGSTHTLDQGMKSYRKTDFSTYDINLDIGINQDEKLRSEIKRSTDMTVIELIEKIKYKKLHEGGRAIEHSDDSDFRELVIELNKKLLITTPMAKNTNAV